MKKAVLKFMLICSIAAVILLAVFFWKNLRGIKPALLDTSRDIVPLIENAQAGDGAGDMPLKLAPELSLSVYAKGLGNPRVMVLDPSGTLLVSMPLQGKLVALPDENMDSVSDRTVTVVDGLKRPHGMAFRCAPDCKLYIAEEDAVNVYTYDQKKLNAVKEKKIADLPKGGGHSTRALLFLPKPNDDRLLISVGSSCNVCNEDDWRRAKILVVPAAGGKLMTFASGLRNSVFMTINPKTKKIWATEMGRDLLGDDLPPDEINVIHEGRDYGWPFCYGKNIHDQNFDPVSAKRCGEPETFPSHIDIPAHSAPLGLAFFSENGWPDEFSNDLLVAYHGSWNRSIPTGYKIVRYRLDDKGQLLGIEDFITGWLAKGDSLGRPVDIMILPNSSILVSDDKAGVIYLIRRKENTR